MHTDRRREHRSLCFRAALLAAGIALFSLLAPTLGHAQYPARPIRLIVPVAPGGAPDVIARVIGERLSPLLGQPIVVENRPGANGNIAMELVAKSAPDGYTLAICADSMIVINPQIYAKMPINTLTDLVPIANFGGSPYFYLVVHPSLPVKNFQEFIEYAKKANPPLTYASAGSGSQHQMMMEMLKLRAGIDLVHVPYKGGAVGTTATLAGEVSAMFSGAPTEPLMRAGKLRGLASTGRARSPLFPELPTIGEFYPGYYMATWMGLFGPAGLPEPVIAKLHESINRALAMPQVKERFNYATIEPSISTLPEFAAQIRADYEKFGKLVKQVGIKVD